MGFITCPGWDDWSTRAYTIRLSEDNAERAARKGEGEEQSEARREKGRHGSRDVSVERKKQ